jgi:hypothetical protein
MTMTTRIIVSIAAAAALVAAVHAQEAPPLKLTPETLAQAIADGESQQPRGLPVVAARIERWLSGTVAPQTLGKMTAEYALMPYDVYLLTPFVRAASTAADAKRRSIAMPAMTPDGVNADGVVVSIVPGPGANARSIASVTLKRGEQVIRPVKSDVQPAAADGRASGAFYFHIEDFLTLPVTLDCVGGAAPFSITLDANDLAAARAAIDVTVSPASYLAKLRAINDANTRASQQQAERDVEQRTQDNAAVYVKSSDYAVVESNAAFTKYRWRATVVNGSQRRQVFDLTARFLDGNGGAIDTVRVDTEVIGANSERELNGEARIEAAKARTFSKLAVVATRKGG